MNDIDAIVLNFDKNSIWLLNICLAFIMFGVSLDLRLSMFKSVFNAPKGLIAGLISQIVLLPLVTFILVYFLNPLPSMALGMFLVAACPGGNISNFFSSVAKSNVELSIVMTCITSVGAIVLTPLNFLLYAKRYPPVESIIQSISIEWVAIVQAIALIIIIPIVLAQFMLRFKPFLAARIKVPLRYISMALFVMIVVFALMSNGNFFMKYIDDIFWLVLLHNGLAIITAFIWSTLIGLPWKDRKTITIETSIQNSGLGLLLIFSFFSGLGGMAVLAAWWGIWHIVMGFAQAYFFRSQDAKYRLSTSVN